eukprot:9056538-Pyramimonas_sp.AAC.1
MGHGPWGVRVGLHADVMGRQGWAYCEKFLVDWPPLQGPPQRRPPPLPPPSPPPPPPPCRCAAHRWNFVSSVHALLRPVAN